MNVNICLQNMIIFKPEGATFWTECKIFCCTLGERLLPAFVIQSFNAGPNLINKCWHAKNANRVDAVSHVTSSNQSDFFITVACLCYSKICLQHF